MLRSLATRAAKRLIGPDRASLLIRLIAENAWEHRWRYAVAIALMATVAATAAAIALTIEQVTEEVFFERRPEYVLLVAGWVAVIFFVRGAAMFGQSLLLARIGNRIVAGLQQRIYAHVLRQGIGFFATEGSGELATRITHNAGAARTALNLLATRLGVDLLTALSLLGVMFYQDWQMSLVALVVLPAILGGVSLLLARVKRLARGEVVMYARILSAMNETVAGARVVKAFNLEGPMRQRMDRAVRGVRGRADRIALMKSTVSPLMEATAGIAAASVILYGGWRVINHGLEVGTFFSFLTALLMLGDPARRLAALSVAMRQHLVGVQFIYDVLDREVTLTERADARPLDVSRGAIRFEAVRFAYGEEPALNGLDLAAAGGRVTALVGPSGAGKSTVLALLERFYDPDAGRITIDGQDLRDVTLASLRASMALVTQETFLFDATVSENIAFGREEASRAEIEAAAQQANAHDFIARLEQGYETPVGEGGSRLSGGQRQRIAIARAMLRDAPILLLDEATSALDAETEERVQQALSRLMRGRTTLVIAHRLATVRQADQICVLEDGRVVERGTHDSLVAERGLYARLADLQFGPESGQRKESA